MLTDEEAKCFEEKMVGDIAAGTKRPAETLPEPPKVIKKPRLGVFSGIDIVEDFDIAEENLKNLVPLFKAADWKIKAKPNTFEMIVDCLHKGIASRQHIGEFAMVMMFANNPLMAELKYDEMYALFSTVLVASSSIFVVVDNWQLYYDLLVDYCMILMPKTFSTLHMREKNKYGVNVQVKVYLCNLLSSRGCQYLVKNDQGGKNLDAMSIELRLNNAALAFIHAWNCFCRDLLIDIFYVLDEKLLADYLAKKGGSGPTLYKRRFFTHFTFEELWDARAARVLKYTGKHKCELLPSNWQYAPNTLSEIAMWRDANFREPKFASMPVQEGCLQKPRKTYLFIPKLELPELPDLSDEPTAAERAEFNAVREKQKEMLEIMGCFLRAEFWNQCPINEPGYYDAKYYHDFSDVSKIVDEANPGVVRHIADMSPDDFVINKENITPEIKKTLFDKFHATEVESTGPSKFKDGKTRKIVTVTFDATKASEKKFPGANPDYVSYEKGFLSDCIFTIAISPAIGAVQNNFNNKPFDNKIFLVNIAPEQVKGSTYEKAVENVIF